LIKSFKCKETQKIFRGLFSKKIPTEILKRSLIKLRSIDIAENVDDLIIPPSTNLESLDGDRKGQYSIRINKQYRICFEWIDNNALSVEIVDYH